MAGSLVVRLVVSLGLLAIVASQVDLATAWSRVSGGSWAWFGLAVVALEASFVLAARRWLLFLRAAAIAMTKGAALRAYLVGAFTSNFLPTQFGGDVTRGWMAGAPGTRVRAMTTVVVDRASALACLIVVAWAVYATDHSSVPASLVGFLALATVGLVILGAVAALLAGGARRASRLEGRIGGAARETTATVRACLESRVITRTFVLGLAFQALVLLAVWLLARTISLEVSFAVLAVVVPAVLILSAAPVSIGGLGVREASFVVLLGRAGVTSTDATVLSLLTAAAFALASIPGALALLDRRWLLGSPQPEDREQERGKEDLHARDEEGGGAQGELALAEGPEALRGPDRDADRGADESYQHQGAADQ